MPAAKEPPISIFPQPLLACAAATVAMAAGARHWEAATGVSYWTWLVFGIVPLAAGALFYRSSKRPLHFLGSRPDPEGVTRPGLGGLLAALVLLLVPPLAGDGAAALALGHGAGAGTAAAAATGVAFAVAVLGYRAAESLLNRRDAASAASPPGPT